MKTVADQLNLSEQEKQWAHDAAMQILPITVQLTAKSSGLVGADQMQLDFRQASHIAFQAGISYIIQMRAILQSVPQPAAGQILQ